MASEHAERAVLQAVEQPHVDDEGGRAVIATLYSWVANRLWTYSGRTRDNATREAILFLFANACGIGISQFCLLFTHHFLELTAALADNIAVYVVGFALGTAFRFYFYQDVYKRQAL